MQISGKSSCMVALPKKWVKEMGLRQGSEIVITRPSLSSLLVTADVTEPVSEKQEAIIEVTERDSARPPLQEDRLALHPRIQPDKHQGSERFPQLRQEGRNQGTR